MTEAYSSLPMVLSAVIYLLAMTAHTGSEPITVSPRLTFAGSRWTT